MKIGLIGCGRIAADHMLVYRHLGNAQVVAVSDIAPNKSRSFANKFGIDKVFTNHIDLLETKDLDFVDVCTPTSTHAPIVCDAAKTGQNVLLEKPMAISTDECERMMHEVEKHGISLCICHNQIFFPAMKQAKFLVDSGDYDLTYFRTSIRENPQAFRVPVWNMTPEEKGILWEVGCHPAYLHLHFLGDITDVYAVGNKVKYPVFDEYAVLLKSKERPYGIMEISWLAKETRKIYEIYSSDGKCAFMEAPPPWASEGYDVLVEKSAETRRVSYAKLKKFIPRFVKHKTPLSYFIGHFHLISSYMKTLRKGSPPPVPPEEGKKTIKLLECIEQSLDTNEVVSLK